MSQDQLSSGSSEERTPKRPSERPDTPGLEPDQIEAARLADVLAAVERRGAADLDPNADPALAVLERTAGVVRSSLEASSAHASFRSFHERSRARVMRATPQPRQPVVDAPRESLLQRWNGLFTSIASAAAASVATLIVTVIALGGGSSTPAPTVQSPAPAPEPAVAAVEPASSDEQVEPASSDEQPERVNLTALSIIEQLSLYVELLERLDALSDDGLPAGEHLLRDLAETGASVARTIEEQPEAVSGADAWVAYQTAFKGQQLLEDATVASEQHEQVLDTAQVAAAGAFVTAARFLMEDPQRAPSADDAARALRAALGPGPTPAGFDPDGEVAP